jgi:hypothetical protein
MRTYGRITNLQTGALEWTIVETDDNGFNDAVWLTTLCQVLLLNLNESPFYADYGIPAKPALVQQVFPDFYVARTQQRFSQYFASLIISKQPLPTPVYDVKVTTNQGAKISAQIAQ